MGSAVGAVGQSDVILSVECAEPEGTVVRDVRRCLLSFEKIRELWDRLGEFEVLFNYQHDHNFERFVRNFIVQKENGEFEPTGLFWEVDDVGLLYLTDIRPEYEASAHFTFWDRRYRGREELLKQMIRYNFEMLNLHRLVVEVPMYAPSLLAFVEKLGFVKEGRHRKTMWYKGQWYDSAYYSLLREEVVT